MKSDQLAHKQHRMFLPLMPDTAVAHGMQNFNGARHVSYTYTPMRYAWTDLNSDGTHTGRNIVVDRLKRAFCKWDRKAASRVHRFAAISQAVSRRIQYAYQRETPIIYPPVETERFARITLNLKNLCK